MKQEDLLTFLIKYHSHLFITYLLYEHTLLGLPHPRTGDSYSQPLSMLKFFVDLGK